MSETSTIAALASPLGTGAIALVRMSGPDALRIFAACTKGKQLKPRYATFCRIYDASNRVLDEVVATYFAAPASFTGEDVVEISCHGGMLVTRRILERLITCGAVPAEAGEFSQRAFINGKLDLTQAEAIMDVIAAGSDLALRAAQNQLGGAISTRVGEAVEQLISVVAHVEAYIDFPEEDISPDTTAALLAQIEAIQAQIETLLSTADEGRLLREGIRTALVGAPNAGKSSLLNCLLGYERAIVSEVAGTTRDTIEERVNIGGLCLRLIDTAGLRESEDAIERAGMERSRQAGAEAQLVLQVVDASQPAADIDLPEGQHTLLILNKADLGLHPSWQDRAEAIAFSCETGLGRPELEAAIEQHFLHGHAEAENYAAINLRHRSALQAAAASLTAAADSITRADSPEFTALDLREALDHLGSITGRIDTEDILGSIFSQFCLGK